MSVRLVISNEEARELADRIVAERGLPTAVMLKDVIWLRAVLIEQQTRIKKNERAAFERRADRAACLM